MHQRKGEKTKRVNCREAPRLSQDGDGDGPTPGSGPRTTEGRQSYSPKALQGLDAQLTAEGWENGEPRTRRTSSAAEARGASFAHTGLRSP